jgi:DNA-binding GntR family transcriptional regulator
MTRGRAGALTDMDAGGRQSDTAYERILELLFERRLPAGAFVSQNELVQLTGVPIAPLRDALRVLEAEGVLTIRPRSGIQFVKPGLELTKSTYQFRTIVERAAVRVFAETADDESLATLKRDHEAIKAEVERDGLNEAIMLGLERLESRLHNSVIAALANPLIDTSYRRIHNYLRLIRLDRKLTPPLALRSIREHLAIIDACEARDPEAAEDARRSGQVPGRARRGPVQAEPLPILSSSGPSA